MSVGQAAEQPPESVPAGRGQRLRAGAMDLLLVGVTAGLGSVIWGAAILQDQGGFFCSNPGSQGFFSECDELGTVAYAGAVAAVCIYALAVLYEPVCVAVWGCTLGKRAARIRVVRVAGGRRVGLGRSVVRWSVPLAPFAVCLAIELGTRHWRPALGDPQWWIGASLGWWLLVRVSSLWDADGLGWHDKAAGTIVVRPRTSTLV